MAYCSYQDIVDHTGTALPQEIVESLIDSADRRIDAMLSAAGIAKPTGGELQGASIAFTKALVLTRYRFDGTRTGSVSVAGYSSSDDLAGMVRQLEEEAMGIVQAYIETCKTTASRPTEGAVRDDADMAAFVRGSTGSIGPFCRW